MLEERRACLCRHLLDLGEDRALAAQRLESRMVDERAETRRQRGG